MRGIAAARDLAPARARPGARAFGCAALAGPHDAGCVAAGLGEAVLAALSGKLPI